MNCLYLDHTAAGVDVRRRFTLTASAREELCRRFQPLGGLVPVATCGRTELYFLCPRGAAEGVFSAYLAERGEGGGASLFSFCEGAEAAVRLFRLAAGLLSMLKGEDEVLGQVRACYEQSRALGCAGGMDAVFQAALACGKRVRAETKISSLACSVATLAATAVFRFRRGGNVLIVGATGKMGGAVLKNIAAKGGWNIAATSRSHAFGAQAEGFTAAKYSERYALLDGADVIVSATSSPHTVFEAGAVAAALKTEKPRLFIDLSVPPDVDAGVAAVRGCRVLGLDGFRAAAEENNGRKRSAILAAEQIAAECAERYFADRDARDFAPALAALPPAERRSLYALRKSDPAAFSARLRALFGAGERSRAEFRKSKEISET